MSIYKINSNLPNIDKIEKLNEMVFEINGKVDQGKFDENEITHLYAQLGTSRKFLRNQTIGGTSGDYTDWSHLSAKDGYSIWKITPTTYVYNANNKLYFDDKILENKGSVINESAQI